jgi:hypothetical protein
MGVTDTTLGAELKTLRAHFQAGPLGSEKISICSSQRVRHYGFSGTRASRRHRTDGARIPASIEDSCEKDVQAVSREAMTALTVRDLPPEETRRKYELAGA